MVNQVPGGPVSLPACHSGPALDLRKMSHERPLIPSVLTSSLYKYKKQHLQKENREEWAQPSSRFRTTQQSKHRVKGIHRSLAATEALPQTRAHIYHIDYGSELRSMLLSIPLTERQQNLMDRMPVSVIQWETSRRVEGLITETLQWPFNRRSTHHMCLIPLRYQRVPTDENTVALQARKVDMNAVHVKRARKTRGDWHGRRRVAGGDFSCQTPAVRFNKDRTKTNCTKSATSARRLKAFQAGFLKPWDIHTGELSAAWVCVRTSDQTLCSRCHVRCRERTLHTQLDFEEWIHFNAIQKSEQPNWWR